MKRRIIQSIAIRLFLFTILSLPIAAAAAQGVPVAPVPAGGEGLSRLGPFLLLESSLEPGADLGFSEGDAGVVVYEGGLLPAGSEGPRMYGFKAYFSLDGELGQARLGAYLGLSEYPYAVYLNGVEILAKGRFRDGRYNSSMREATALFLPPALLKPAGERNELLVQAYPREERWGLDRIHLGELGAVSRAVFLRNLAAVVFVKAAVVMSALIGLYFLALYLGQRERSAKYLYFALICLSFCLSYFNILWHYEANDEAFLEALSKAGLALLAAGTFAFVLEYAGLLSGRAAGLSAAPWALGLLSGGAVFLQREKGAMLAVFGAVMNFVIVPQLLACIGVLLVSLLRRRNRGAVPLLLAFAAVIYTSISDVLALNASRIPYAWAAAYGFLAIVVASFVILAKEQSDIARALARQSGALNERNRMLREMVGDLTGVAEGLISSSASLEGTLDSTLRSVESFGEETRLAAEVFRLQMGAVESEIAQISERMALSAERVPKALDSQTQAVEEMNATLAEMKEKIDASGESAEESNRIAGELAKEAEGGRAVIGESRRAMGQVAELSGALQGVLSSIEDIAERTHVLSINAAIESARLGAEGKGFAVVAQEIRKLSEQSRTSLGSSFAKIAEMAESVGKSAELSDRAAETLGGIAEESRRSAERTEAIRRLIEEQREQGRAMLKDAESLLSEARLLKELSGEEKRSNEEREAQFRAMKESLQAVSRKLSEQEAHKRELGERLSEMRRSAEANAGHIAALRSAIDKVRGSLAG